MTLSINEIPRAKLAIAIGLAIGCFVLVRTIFPHFGSLPGSGVIVREGLLLALIALLLWYVAKIEELNLRDLGFQPMRLRSLASGVAVSIVLIAAGAIFVSAMRTLGVEQDTGTLSEISRRPFWVILLIALTAGVSEEIAFRGVLIDHLGAFAKSRVVGATLSVIAFSAFHMNGWGLTQFLFVLPSGVILTLFYCWRKDLTACVIAHVLTDAVGLSVAAALHH